MKRFILLLLLALLCLPAFGATTIYVGSPTTSPVGNDGNSGADAAHPKTLNGSLASLGPDVTLILLDGTYVGPGGGRIAPSISGTAGHPWIMRALNTWKAVITGSSQEGFQPSSGVSYYRLEGIVSSNNASQGFSQDLGHDITYFKCWAVTNHNSGWNIGHGNSNVVVDSCLGTWNGFVGAGGDQYHGVYFGHQGNTVRNSVFAHNSGYGIQLYDGYVADFVNSNRIYNNFTYSNNRSGLNTTYGCTVYGAYGNNMALNPGENYVYGNTFIDGAKFRGGTIDLTNNIILPVSFNQSHPVVYATPNAPVIHADYNMSIRTLDSAGAHDVVNTNPGLVSTNNGLPWIKSTSPARGTAASAICGTVDWFDNAQSSVAAIGAVQYSLTLENDVRNLDTLVPTGYWDLINPPSYYAGAPNSVPPGNDANDGLTAATPKTLATSLSALGPGITVWMLDGNYVGAGGGRISISKSGNIGSPAYIRAVNKWGAIVDHSTQEGMQISGTQSNLVFDGIKFQYCQADGLCLNTGCSNIVIQNIWSISNLQNGINMTDPGQMGNTIDSCMLEKNGNFTTHSYHGAYVSGQNHIVRNNVARNNAGYGIQFYTGYAGNLQHNCQFYNNLTFGQGTFHYGFAMWNANGNDGSSAGTNYAYNNTFADGMTCEYGWAGLTNNVTIPSGLSFYPIDYALGTGREPTGVWEDYNWSTVAFYSVGAFLHKGANDTVTDTSVLFRNPANGLYWIPGLGQTAAGALGSPTPLATPDFYSQPVGAQTHVGFMSFRYNLAGDVRDLVSTNFPDYWQTYVDPNAPVISGITVTVAQTTAGVIWTTDEPSTSLLEWGLTVAYGSSSSDANPVVVHHRAATGLAAGTTYHFRVRSTDNFGNTSTSSDGTFTTTPSPVSPPSVQFKGQVILQGEGGAIFK